MTTAAPAAKNSISLPDADGNLVAKSREKERNQNNLSNTRNNNQAPADKASFIVQADSTNKLQLSFSDEENTETLEDSGVPKPPRRLDSMTFDEFEALST